MQIPRTTFRDATTLPVMPAPSTLPVLRAFPDATPDSVADMRLWLSDTKPMPAAPNVGIKVPVELETDESRYAGASFADAVAQATRLAATEGVAPAEHAAQAVVLSSDGGYYLMPVCDDEGGDIVLNPTGLKRFEGVRVRSRFPALRALVDVDRWIDFTHAPVSPSSASRE
jgi:hypothetical protein